MTTNILINTVLTGIVLDSPLMNERVKSHSNKVIRNISNNGSSEIEWSRTWRPTTTQPVTNSSFMSEILCCLLHKPPNCYLQLPAVMSSNKLILKYLTAMTPHRLKNLLFAIYESGATLYGNFYRCSHKANCSLLIAIAYWVGIKLSGFCFPAEVQINKPSRSRKYCLTLSRHERLRVATTEVKNVCVSRIHGAFS